MSLNLTADPRRKRFSRQDVEQMEKAGLFDGERLELINGELIDKMGQNPPHAYLIKWLHQWLGRLFGFDRIQAQLPLEMREDDQKWNWPEPDLAVLREGTQDSKSSFARGADALLVIEVADTTLRTDLTVKRDLYARAGIPEYWVLDVNRARLIAHRNPNNDSYSEISEYAESESIPVPDTNRIIPVAELLTRNPNRS